MGHVDPSAAGPISPGGSPPDPVATLERSVAAALRRPPCLVSFSGGHDSSLVLAAAMRVARREGLPLPVPVTWRPTGAPRAEESAWQELVVAALEIEDWIRLPTGDDLDFVGPVSTAVLRRHGLLHPANTYFHAPLLEEAAGGSLITGIGGDQLLGRLRRPRRPAWAPRRVVADPPYGWLLPPARRRVRRDLRREHRARPRRYRDRPAWLASRRGLTLSCLSLALLGRDTDTDVVHPLLDASFATAVCHSSTSPNGAEGRAGLLRRVFAGTYPEAVLRPRPKATFGEVFWRRHTRAVLAAWDGTGVDPTVVDRARLRLEWDRPQPDLSTAMLVQQVWLATTSRTGTS